MSRGLVLVPEGRELFPGLTVEEHLNLAFRMVSPRGRAPERERELAHVRDLFPKLRERSQQYAGSLSGGEQQMLALARGLLLKPKVSLLDEPSLGLAPVVVDEVMNTLVTLNRDGLTVLMLEQDVRRALEASHRAYFLKSGRLSGGNSSDELRQKDDWQQDILGGSL